jgi:general secretion pathway protein I
LRKVRSERGISLLEVLIAVTIASIALISFIILVVRALDVEDYARKVTDATLIADEKLKEIERGPFPETGKIEGNVEESDTDGFTFRIAVTETSISDIRQAEVEVLWDQGKHSVNLIGYVVNQ